MKALKERYRLIDDAEKEMSWWACFEENKHRKVKLGWDTPIRKAPKVGRNEPCPCGSGKKFKKCRGHLVGRGIVTRYLGYVALRIGVGGSGQACSPQNEDG